MTQQGKNAFDNPARAIELDGNNVQWLGNLIVTGSITSSGVGGLDLANNVYLVARNAANTANLNLLKADASNNTVLNAATGKQISFDINAAVTALLNATEFAPNTALGLTLGTAAKPFGQAHLGLGATVAVKAGSNGKAGTVTVNGATPVTVATTAFVAGSVVQFSLKTVGGIVGAIPHLATATPGTGFTVVGTAADTSVYNWVIIDTE